MKPLLKPLLLPLLALGLTVGLFACASAGSPAPTSPSKKLIEYGWGSPSPEELADQGQLLEDSVFDGITFRLSGRSVVFNRTAFDKKSFDNDIKLFARIKSNKLAQSFIRVLSNSEAGWDWANDSDWQATSENIRNIARVAKAAGLRGVIFDAESYENNPWNIASRPGRQQYGFGGYQAKVRERGASFMRSLEAEYPGLQFFSLRTHTDLFGLVADSPSAAVLQQRLSEESGLGLWPSFVDGLLDAAGPKVKLIEGNENAYYYLHAQQFDDYRRDLALYGPRLVAPENQSKYRQSLSAGNAIYLDGIMNLHQTPRFCGYFIGSDNERLRLLEHNSYHSLRSSDEWVWLYDENVNWWRGSPPLEMQKTLQRSKDKIKNGQGLGLDMKFVDQAEKACQAKVTIGGDLQQNDSGVPGTVMMVDGVSNERNCVVYNDGRAYGCTFANGWSGSIGPKREGTSFAPASRSYKNVIKDDYGEDYQVK
jgi:hypothetical protein